MNTQQNQVPQNTEKLKEIPKWTRKYAQNRTLTAFVLMVMICLYSMGIGVTSYLVARGFIKGHIILASACIVVLAAILIFPIIFISKFGGKNRGLIGQKMDQWIYGREGIASMPVPELTKKKKWLDFVGGAVFFVCMLGSMNLSMVGFIAFKYLQPLSVLYVVPFLVFQYFLQRPRVGPLFLICPILYTIHAILIVVGVPIFFTGYLRFWNMFIPLVGYMFLTYVIAHLYSRYALKKLKGITHLEGEAANGD